MAPGSFKDSDAHRGAGAATPATVVASLQACNDSNVAMLSARTTKVMSEGLGLDYTAVWGVNSAGTRTQRRVRGSDQEQDDGLSWLVKLS